MALCQIGTNPLSESMLILVTLQSWNILQFFFLPKIHSFSLKWYIYLPFIPKESRYFMIEWLIPETHFFVWLLSKWSSGFCLLSKRQHCFKKWLPLLETMMMRNLSASKPRTSRLVAKLSTYAKKFEARKGKITFYVFFFLSNSAELGTSAWLLW